MTLDVCENIFRSLTQIMDSLIQANNATDPNSAEHKLFIKARNNLSLWEMLRAIHLAQF
jgi:hypothetical protein